MDDHNFAALREEIQRDRFAMMDTINDGFDRLMDKFEEHAQKDAEEFANLRERITSVEGTTKTIRNGLVGTIAALVSAATTWLFGKL